MERASRVPEAGSSRAAVRAQWRARAALRWSGLNRRCGRRGRGRRVRDNGTDHDFDVEIQVADHMGDDADLLGRLCGRSRRYVGLHDFEKVLERQWRRRGNGRGASGLAGRSLHVVDVDISAEAGRIDVGGLWSEDAHRRRRRRVFASRPRRCAILARSSSGPNCVGLTKIDVTTCEDSRRARSTSAI